MNDGDRPVQYFTDEYLAHCRSMTSTQICEFLDDYRQIARSSSAPATVPRRAISIRIQEPLLRAFKEKAKMHGVAYQTQIHRLMEAWVRGD